MIDSFNAIKKGVADFLFVTDDRASEVESQAVTGHQFIGTTSEILSDVAKTTPTPRVVSVVDCHPRGRSPPRMHQKTSNHQRIFVAGHRGMVGSAMLRALASGGFQPPITRTRDELDLCNQGAVDEFFSREKPDCVIFAAAKVGGIHANNTYPADFARDNALMATFAIDAAFRNGVPRFLFLGSTCIYPRMAPQPIPEASLLTSPLETTNEAYALAKILGLKLCQYYRRQHGVTYHSAMPTNLYGPGDNYHAENSHVIPALIRRFHQAKVQQDPSVSVWGTGTPRREFLHVDDLAAAVLMLIGLPDPPDWVNVGTGTDIAISELSKLVAKKVGYTGSIVQDLSKPDGTPLKRTDTTLINDAGWVPQIDLESGLEQTYKDFLQQLQQETLRS